MSEGTVSVTSCTVPLYSGARPFSKVARYLTLSLASFAASVICMSMGRQRFAALVLPAFATASTNLHSLVLSCSVMEKRFAMRARQYSSSVSGPGSSPSLMTQRCASRRSASMHHLVRHFSTSFAVPSSDAACAYAVGLASHLSTRAASGFWSSTPPLTVWTASDSMELSFAVSATNSLVLASFALPHCCCSTTIGQNSSATRALKFSRALPWTSPTRTSVSRDFSFTPFGFSLAK
mmetsp:Transcript_6086/g.18798  ORF Transcript_6086/g.18798 Transcript_6086/m.18798 type:complete len:236 (-) Transcript_6086:448-1155(-)